MITITIAHHNPCVMIWNEMVCAFWLIYGLRKLTAASYLLYTTTHISQGWKPTVEQLKAMTVTWALGVTEITGRCEFFRSCVGGFYHLLHPFSTSIFLEHDSFH